MNELKNENEKLSKKINKKVMGMIENAEREYEELNRKRQVRLKPQDSRPTSRSYYFQYLLLWLVGDPQRQG